MKSTYAIFQDINGAVSHYGSSMLEIVHDYKKKTSGLTPDIYTQSELDRRTAEAKASAAERIPKAQELFHSTMSKQVKELQKVLKEHLTTPPSETLMKKLAVYRDFNLGISRTELDYLLELNNGNSLGIRAINSILERNHSPYKIVTHEDEYEADIRMLEGIAESDSMPSLDLVSDVAKLTGKDFQRLLINSSSLTHRLSEIAPMAERWDNTIPPTVEQLKAYTDINDPDTGKRITAEQQIEIDRRKAAESAEVTEESPAVAYAKRLARQKREEIERGKAALEQYTK